MRGSVRVLRTGALLVGMSVLPACGATRRPGSDEPAPTTTRQISAAPPRRTGRIPLLLNTAAGVALREAPIVTSAVPTLEVGT